MLLSQHAIVGAAIGIGTGNPALGFVGGVASHHLLDCLPHIDNNIVSYILKRPSDDDLVIGDYLIASVDVLITIGILFLLMKHLPADRELIIAGALGGSLPDIIDHVPLWREPFRKSWLGSRYHWFHDKFHWKLLNGPIIALAIVLQLVMTIGGIWVCWRGF